MGYKYIINNLASKSKYVFEKIFPSVEQPALLRGRMDCSKGLPLAKSCLNILVDEIAVEDKTATIKVRYAAWVETMQTIKKGNLSNQVPVLYIIVALGAIRKHAHPLDCRRRRDISANKNDGAQRLQNQRCWN